MLQEKKIFQLERFIKEILVKIRFLLKQRRILNMLVLKNFMNHHIF